MANSYFQFKQFTVHQDSCAMKVTTDGCLFGAWIADIARSRPFCNLSPKGRKVLDIGTGTGLLSLMLVQKNPQLLIDALEIDQDAAEQASQNVMNSPWATTINVIQADAREFDAEKKYQMIISNPPFYEKELKGDDTKKNIAHHNDGLLLPDLLKVIKDNLTPGGIFFLLLPYKRNEEIKNLLIKHEMVVEELTFVRQTNKHDYFRIMIQGKLSAENPTETKIGEIVIKDDEEKYSPEFHGLLKDYYLHL